MRPTSQGTLLLSQYLDALREFLRALLLFYRIGDHGAMRMQNLGSIFLGYRY